MSEEVSCYCVKCRTKKTMSDVQQVKMKNCRPALKGVCSVCGTGMYKIVAVAGE